MRSLADFPDDLAPLRAALHRAHIRPTWNLTAGQADQVRRDLDRCGERVLVAAAYAASTGRAPLAWWSGLLSTFAGALPAPAPDSTGAHSPVDGDAGATPAPASPAQRAQHADELRKSLGWAPRPRPDRKDAQP